MSFDVKKLRTQTTLTRWLPERIVTCFLEQGWIHPGDLRGKTTGDLYRLQGFGHSAFYDLVKRLWDMGLHLDHNGVLQANVEPMPTIPRVFLTTGCVVNEQQPQ